ncbi:MAG: hypothetical protein Q9N62_02190 [Ghiorsea sp.]|nr:hypothetical protein [Ghiorsea sp.]
MDIKLVKKRGADDVGRGKGREEKETQEALQSGGVRFVKHYDGSKGLAGFNGGKYKIVKDGDKAKDMMVFNSINELSDAGWTITT